MYSLSLLHMHVYAWYTETQRKGCSVRKQTIDKCTSGKGSGIYIIGILGIHIIGILIVRMHFYVTYVFKIKNTPTHQNEGK